MPLFLDSLLLGRSLAAEDAAQEAFLLVVRHRGRYQAGKPFSPWFYTILRNVCRGMHRGQSRQMKLMGEAAAQLQQQQAPGQSPELPSMHEMLAELDAADRAVLLLRVVEGMGFEEIAVAIGISKEAAKKRGQRALMRIRQSKLARQWYGAGSSPATGDGTEISPTGESPDGGRRSKEMRDGT